MIMLSRMFRLITSWLQWLWDLVQAPFKSHPCSKCDCKEYSDEEFFMWMKERSKYASYADEMLSAGVLNRPLKCSICSHMREEHGALTKKLLTCDYMPDGGVIHVEQQRRATFERRERRFENRTTLRERRPSVEVKTVKEGEGVALKSGDVIMCHYDAYNKSTMERFETSRDGEPLRYTVGAAEVVPGWEMGMKGAKNGEKRKITVPPELAYRGREICGERNVTIVFDVEVLSVDYC